MKTEKVQKIAQEQTTNSEQVFSDSLQGMTIAGLQELRLKLTTKHDEACYHWRLCVEENLIYPSTLEAPEILASRLAQVTIAIEEKRISYKTYVR